MDRVSRFARSKMMASIRSRNNRTTERLVASGLRRARVTGWRRHTALPGTPDFTFASSRVVIFVNGCFWHGCRRCKLGHRPKSHVGYWIPKIERTKRRDVRVRRELHRRGYRTLVIWEHELKKEGWLQRLLGQLKKASR